MFKFNFLRSRRKPTEPAVETSPRPVREIPEDVRPRLNQPPLPSLGLDLDATRESFTQISVGGSPRGGLAGYALQDFERFFRTVDLVPPGAMTGLEIGANPYFTSVLMHWTRPEVQLQMTNFFGESFPGRQSQVVSLTGLTGPEEIEFPYYVVNIESEPIPLEDHSLDMVMYCEVLEHMLNDPVKSLKEIHRVIKPGGHLVLTTPNAARLESAARLIGGLNMYDQYSGHGPYGRHNREYTVEEVTALLLHCGFELDVIYTADVHANHAALHVENPRLLSTICLPRKHLLGQYIFSRWKRTERQPSHGRPQWLYRSIADSDLSSDWPLTEPPGARW